MKTSFCSFWLLACKLLLDHWKSNPISVCFAKLMKNYCMENALHVLNVQSVNKKQLEFKNFVFISKETLW